MPRTAFSVSFDQAALAYQAGDDTVVVDLKGKQHKLYPQAKWPMWRKHGLVVSFKDRRALMK